MNVLGLDTATPATAVALRRSDGWMREARDEPAGGARPQHGQRLLALARELLAEAAVGWSELDMVAVGVGPGGYTGMRIGLASAHGLALAHGAKLAGVGTLRALAEAAGGGSVAAVIDARRGEAFVAVYRDGEELLAPRVCAAGELARLVLAADPRTVAVGDGALRYRGLIVDAGGAVAPSDSALHAVSAAAICRLALAGKTTAAAADYQRLADAELALGARTR